MDLMPIRLTIEIASPLDPDDRDLLSGVAVMTLAIANHEMAKTRFPETFTDDEETVSSRAGKPGDRGAPLRIRRSYLLSRAAPPARMPSAGLAA